MSKIPQSTPVVRSKTKAELDKELDKLEREARQELRLLDKVFSRGGAAVVRQPRNGSDPAKRSKEAKR